MTPNSTTHISFVSPHLYISLSSKSKHFTRTQTQVHNNYDMPLLVNVISGSLTVFNGLYVVFIAQFQTALCHFHSYHCTPAQDNKSTSNANTELEHTGTTQTWVSRTTVHILYSVVPPDRERAWLPEVQSLFWKHLHIHFTKIPKRQSRIVVGY